MVTTEFMVIFSSQEKVERAVTAAFIAGLRISIQQTDTELEKSIAREVVALHFRPIAEAAPESDGSEQRAQAAIEAGKAVVFISSLDMDKAQQPFDPKPFWLAYNEIALSERIRQAPYN